MLRTAFRAAAPLAAALHLSAPPAAADVVLNPFTEVDTLGRLTFGFTFDFFGAMLTPDGVRGGGENALAQAGLFFAGRALSPTAGLVEMRVHLSSLMGGLDPARTFLVSSTVGMVGGVSTGAPCAP